METKRNTSRRYVCDKQQINRSLFLTRQCEKGMEAIIEKIKQVGDEIFSMCKPQPTLLVKVTEKSHTRVSWCTDKPFFFIISIYVAGCNVRWNVECNIRSKMTHKSSVRKMMRSFQKEKNLQKPKNLH